jgi:hypothetical protein
MVIADNELTNEKYNEFGSRNDDTVPQEYAYGSSSPSNAQLSQDGPQMGGESGGTLNIEPQKMAVDDIENI